MAELSAPVHAAEAASQDVRGAEWRLLRLQVLLLAVVLGLILAVGSYLQDRASVSIGRLIHSTTVARQQVNAVNDVLDGLQDAETGQRGFLLTLQPSYLAPYEQAVARLQPALDRLAALGRETPWLQADAAELRTVVQEKLAELAETVALARNGRVQDAMGVMLTDRGRALMDAARRRVERIGTHAEADRAALAGQLQREQSFLADATQSALVVGLLLLGFALLVVLWSRARLVGTQLRERALAARLEAAVARIRDGIAVFDRSGQLILSNTQFAPTLGVPAALVQPGLSWTALLATQTLTPPLLQGPAGTPGAPAQEARQGERTLEVWRGPMPDGGQMLAVADITRRVQAEEIARQAQKMDVLGQMTGGVAHDFNNLLQVVSANLELIGKRLRRADAPDGWLLTRLEAARAGVERGARLTRHLLAFARRQPLAPEALDPARVLMGMEDMLRRTVGGMIELELVVGGGLWAIRADPNQLENALLNLSLNARDAMGTGAALSGHLTIEAANAALDESYAAQAAEVRPGQYVMFAVTDTGLGMTPEQLARATEPFYTTKPEGQGTGLGLSMVYGFAKQSGGHFQLYSEPGRGTTAKLYIPRTLTAARPNTEAAAEPPAAAGELVLLVEDDQAVRHSAADTLRGLGYTVTEAADADAALALLSSGTRPAILFTDVVMPGRLSSRALAEQAQRMVPGLAVLFTSGYTQNAIVHNGQLDPGINLLSKPWRTEDLARRLHAILADARARPAVAPRRRVLLVEDEELVRMTTADLLMEFGYDVIEAASGAQALSLVAGGADVLITDLGLPDMDGLALAAELRTRFPAMPIIISSGRSEGPDGFVWLAKPYDAPALQAALRRAAA